MEKGKLIHTSTPPSTSAIIVGWLFFLGMIFFLTEYILDWIYHPFSPPNGLSLFSYTVIHIIGIFAVIFGAIYMPFYKWGQGFRIYENGVTLPYSNFFNWYRGYKKEGKFLPYWKILGYDGDSLQPKKTKKKKIKKDAVFIIYWDDKKNKLRFTIYGENPNDMRILREQFHKNNVQYLPSKCPVCGKKLLGMDYLNNQCLKCHHKLFEVPPKPMIGDIGIKINKSDDKIKSENDKQVEGGYDVK